VGFWNANSRNTSLKSSNVYEGAEKTSEVDSTNWTLGASSCQGITCSFKFSRSLSASPEITVDEEYVVTTMTGLVQLGAEEGDQSTYMKICIGDCTEEEVDATEMASTNEGSGAITNLVATATALAAILMF